MGEFLPFKSKSFDWVVVVTALHNFESPEKGISEIKRVAKKNVVLSILKKAKNFRRIDELIRKNFKVKDEFEEEKDMMYFCEKA